MENGQRNANWSFVKDGVIISDKPDGILVSGATGEDAMNYYGGNLIGESVTKGIAEMIISDHKLIKELLEITETDRNNLCDLVWWLKGYYKGAGNTFDECPFDDNHLKSLDLIIRKLRDILNARKDADSRGKDNVA